MVATTRRQTSAAAAPSAGQKRSLAQSIGSAKKNSASSIEKKSRAKAAAPTATSTSQPEEPASPTKKRKKDQVEVEVQAPLPLLPEADAHVLTTLPTPTLPFCLKTATDHLITHDVRFARILDNVELKPFVDLEDGTVRELNLWRTLTTSIIGQQISWLAARSVNYKFCRLFKPDLPEKPDFATMPREGTPFPTPHAVVRASDEFLRSAGLSRQKVAYVRDIATRFADGRLDVRRIVTLDEETLLKELVQIKGVGVWTAQMLLMFALRRPNILPVGDLGVQKGMLHFFLAGKEGPTINESKKSKKEKQKAAKKEQGDDAPLPVAEDQLSASQAVVENELLGGASTTQTGPTPFDPDAAQHDPSAAPDREPPSLTPDMPTLATLRARVEGKKVKNNYLLPAEMEALSEPWKPYRSVGVFMMWALVDV